MRRTNPPDPAGAATRRSNASGQAGASDFFESYESLTLPHADSRFRTWWVGPDGNLVPMKGNYKNLSDSTLWGANTVLWKGEPGEQGDVHLEFITVNTDFRGHGVGSQILKEVTRMADEANLSISLEPLPRGGPLSGSDLESWYRRYGFETLRHPEYGEIEEVLIRYPQTRRSNAGAIVSWRSANPDLAEYRHPGGRPQPPRIRGHYAEWSAHRAAQSEPVELEGWHGTFTGTLPRPRKSIDFGGLHIGTWEAAVARLADIDRVMVSMSGPFWKSRRQRHDQGVLFPVRMVLKRPWGTLDDPVSETEWTTMVGTGWAKRAMADGFDGAVYYNVVEDPGSVSAVAFDPLAVEVVGEPVPWDEARPAERYLNPSGSENPAGGRSGEAFYLMGAGWDVAKAWRIVEAAPREAEEHPTKAVSGGMLGFIAIDKDYAATTDPTEPGIVALLPSRGGVLIDGWHRLWKATEMGQELFPVYVLTKAESEKVRME